MGIITEYLKLMIEGLKHPDDVIEGWVNDAKLENGNLSDDETTEIIRRRKICEECPFMSRNAIKAGNYSSNRTDDHCIHCKCPIKKKTACLNCNCGIENYNRLVKKEAMPLKWTSYKPDKNDEPSTTV